jgi:hypothetical protein
LKPDGTIRLCTDFRRLNKLITPEPWTLPKVEDIVEKASKGTWHTKIDLKQGFLQQFLHPESCKYTAFIANNEVWEYTRLPFGLKNSPFEFQRLMT